MTACPKAHKSCGDTHDGHHCWKNPGHTGAHGCICWLPWKGDVDD